MQHFLSLDRLSQVLLTTRNLCFLSPIHVLKIPYSLCFSPYPLFLLPYPYSLSLIPYSLFLPSYSYSLSPIPHSSLLIHSYTLIPIPYSSLLILALQPQFPIHPSLFLLPSPYSLLLPPYSCSLAPITYSSLLIPSFIPGLDKCWGQSSIVYIQSSQDFGKSSIDWFNKKISHQYSIISTGNVYNNHLVLEQPYNHLYIIFHYFYRECLQQPCGSRATI